MTRERGERRLRVAVLMGGESNERAVSLSTGSMIVQALDPAKYDAIAIDIKDLPRLLTSGGQSAAEGIPTANETQASAFAEDGNKADSTTSPAFVNQHTPPVADQHLRPTLPDNPRPDLVFIALHGKGGEDGSIQGLLETLKIPYTGSGILASALAMDKARSKALFRAAGLPTIADIVVTRDALPDETELIARVYAVLGTFPVFVKPNAEGSTFGCALVRREEELHAAVADALRYDARALIETYVEGMEITVGVLGNAGGALQALPLIEIVPKSAFYDYESKYAAGGSDHIIPARLTAALTETAQDIARRCHELLGCRAMSRTDMIVADGHCYVLETNTIPGMTPTSLLPQAAAHAGLSFPALLDRIIALSLGETSPPTPPLKRSLRLPGEGSARARPDPS